MTDTEEKKEEKKEETCDNTTLGWATGIGWSCCVCCCIIVIILIILLVQSSRKYETGSELAGRYMASMGERLGNYGKPVQPVVQGGSCMKGGYGDDASASFVSNLFNKRK